MLICCRALPTAAMDPGLPPEVRAALSRAQMPAGALSAVVQDVDAGTALLSWQAQRPVNPASLFKLATTYAALDLLGPAYAWSTPVWLTGALHDGVLEGNLVIKGQGDPKLVIERLWLLLRRVQQMGVREIRGDIVLDRSAFVIADGSPAEFDGEPLRPYNVRPDALLLSYKAVVYTFTPDAARGVARVGTEPALQGLQVDAHVPLLPGPCDDWRAALKATPGDAERMRFAGGYPGSCGERSWPLAYADPASYNARLLQALWRELGGTLAGSVRDGPAPATPPSFEVSSPALAEVVRDINKYSNNPMAQQLFLTLGLVRRGSGTVDNARAVLRDWLQLQLGERAEGLVVDNGSGLSRETRLSAEGLAQLLHSAWRSPVMPELLASLPVAGVDGTARRSRGGVGRAHLKTGSLKDVAAVAGLVLGPGGRRRIVVGIINHPQAELARPALDALVQWAIKQSS
ncbi:D-alanyl-D-alanine carboxypeptidase/D-alanyl-D-alanine endopeptidase [Aquabacterium sp.]|uniref:D-alanyl-D-alanine carboxypeptidase/D-alanyl-D-alanine endopeptidase n=1 Tax=Aquabacterium sp. TaxID=1872578 RepID=UPI002C084AD1|nr:D-alanyl-D-alanine carboxypeptidase/D-alanyl-D-alanine-endopeptidase [Aquabacterium sp.]HSW04996.1 D-alanyl-D-alanine carboxypeptidase/D-alanyl-D-alanine-endopeptidase [Aquabacterium sp.]